MVFIYLISYKYKKYRYLKYAIHTDTSRKYRRLTNFLSQKCQIISIKYQIENTFYTSSPIPHIM